jgi:hypothetical protein
MSLRAGDAPVEPLRSKCHHSCDWTDLVQGGISWYDDGVSSFDAANIARANPVIAACPNSLLPHASPLARPGSSSSASRASGRCEPSPILCRRDGTRAGQIVDLAPEQHLV